MSRSLQNGEFQGSQDKCFTLHYRFSIRKVQISTMVDGSTTTISQLLRTNNIIFIPVSFKNMRNHQFIPAGNIQIDFTVTTRINHSCNPRGSNEI